MCSNGRIIVFDKLQYKLPSEVESYIHTTMLFREHSVYLGRRKETQKRKYF